MKRLYNAAMWRWPLMLGYSLSLLILSALPFLWASAPARGQHWVFTYDQRQRDGLLAQHNLDLTFSRNAAFSWYANDWGRWSYRELTVPYWAVLASSALCPMIWWAQRRRSRRAALSGLCPTCGYDLRATPLRCPECGAAAPAFTL